MPDETGKDASTNGKLEVRTKRMPLRVIRMVGAIPKWYAAEVIVKQLIRSATSVGAHYREAHFARSPAEFVSKLSVGIQETAESQYWMELLVDAELVTSSRTIELQQEMKEILAMMIASVKTAKTRRN